jgi:amino acid adenylation domain-containing protein
MESTTTTTRPSPGSDGALDDLWEGPATGLPAQQGRRRAEFNATARALPVKQLQMLVAAQVALRPGQPALVWRGGRMTYAELARRARDVARRLEARGVRPNSLVAIVMDKGWEQVVAALGVLIAGAAYLPIDARWPAERRRQLLGHGEVRVALTQSWMDAQASADGAQDWPADVERIAVDALAAPAPEVDEETAWEARQRLGDLAYVIYTSGSTGQPKGVMIEHEGAANTILDVNRRFGVGPGDRVLALSSLSFDLSVYDLFGTLAAGGTIVLPDPDGLRDPAHWLELLRDHGVTIWNSVPALMEMLVEHLAGAGTGLPPSVRLALLSGDWIPVELPGRIGREGGGRVQVVSLGGATEVSIWSILHPVAEVDASWTSIPYGRPMTNQRVYVLGERHEDCPEWVPGELYIGGIGLARGYWRDEEKTRRSFVSHPVTGERLYRTGDLGRFRPEGSIEFLGREDFQVKVNGHRIELGEVEAALLRTQGVREAVVVAAGEPRGHRRLVGYVVMADGAAFDVPLLQRSLRERLPEYMVPAAIVALASMPLTANGKVDRRTLPPPDAAATKGPRSFVAPRTPLEERLVALWGEVLRRDAAQIGTHDNFFELGGDSLLVVQLLRKARQELGSGGGQHAGPEIQLRELLADPTVSHMADLCEGRGRAASSIIVPIQADGERPPLFFVPAADGNVFVFKKLAARLGRAQPLYGLQAPADATGAPAQGKSIEETAAANVAALRSVRPSGPYTLGGYCWGCTVALEMARQLRAAGDEVEGLVLVDPLHPTYYGYFLENPTLLIGLLAQVMNLGREVGLMSSETLDTLSLDEQLRAAYDRLRRDGAILEEMGFAEFAELFRYFTGNLEALVRHSSSAWDGKAALVLVEDYPSDWLEYWKGLLVGALDVIHLAGNHYSIWVDDSKLDGLHRELARTLGVR